MQVYYITLHYTTLHYTILYYIILYYIILYYIILYYIILYYIILYYIIYISHCSGRQPKTYVKPEAAITDFELLMMGGVVRNMLSN